MSTALEAVREIAETMCRSMDLFLVDVEIRGHQRNPLFVIYADNEEGITLDQCEELSRLIQGEIDVRAIAPAGYRLDVSSPGVDRPLTEDYQFRRNIGRELKVSYRDGDSVLNAEGRLDAFDDKTLFITPPKGDQKEIDRGAIIQAKVKLQW